MKEEAANLEGVEEREVEVISSLPQFRRREGRDSDGGNTRAALQSNCTSC